MFSSGCHQDGWARCLSCWQITLNQVLQEIIKLLFYFYFSPYTLSHVLWHWHRMCLSVWGSSLVSVWLAEHQYLFVSPRRFAAWLKQQQPVQFILGLRVKASNTHDRYTNTHNKWQSNSIMKLEIAAICCNGSNNEAGCHFSCWAFLKILCCSHLISVTAYSLFSLGIIFPKCFTWFFF